MRLRVGTVDRTFPVGADQPGCAAAAGGISCTFTLSVLAGAQTLKIDALDAGGAVISSSSQPLTVEAGATSRLAEVYDAQQEGQASTGLDRGGVYTLAVTLRDADGQAILNPGLGSFTVCSSNPAFTLSGAGTLTPELTATEPGSAAQATTLFVPPDGSYQSQDGALASQAFLVGGSTTSPRRWPATVWWPGRAR